MEKIKISDKTFRKSIVYSEIQKIIDDVASKVNDDYRGCDDVPVLLCVLNGAIIFTSEILQRLEFPVELASLRISSYNGTEPGKLSDLSGLTTDVRGRRVIVCDDIVDTGHTYAKLRTELLDRGAADVKICTMLTKPGRLDADVRIDYCGRETGDAFLVGFGFDYNGLGRNTRDIYELDE